MNFFNDEDRELINGIHLSKMVKEDTVIWKETDTRKFLVQSAYFVARKVHGFPNINKADRDRL